MPRFTLLVAWAIVYATTVPVFAQSAVPQALLDRAAGGPVRVLVRLAATPPDARGLGTALGRAQAQQRMVAAGDRVQAALDTPAAVRRYQTLPWIAASVSREELARLAQHPDVVQIEPDVLMRPALAESTRLIDAPTLWNFGYTGAGWSIAILDTGVDASHPFFGGRVIEQACFSSNVPGQHATSLCPGGVTTSDAADSALPCSFAGCNHGTHVAGIAAGRAAQGSGVARAANIIAIQVFSRIDDPEACKPDASPCLQSYSSDQIAALDYLFAQAGAGNAAHIAAANMSLAVPGPITTACDTGEMAPLKTAIDALRTRGIPTIVSSGNQGSITGISQPACISSAISVGSTEDQFDVVSDFSNRSPLLSLVAPGDHIISSVPGGGFSEMWGTSMAAPHVAGAWALMKQIAPGASVDTILGVLRSTGTPIPDVNHRQYPRIQLDRAALALYGGVPPAPGPPTAPHISLAGGVATLAWSPPDSGGPVGEYIVAVGTGPGAANLAVLSAGSALSLSGQVPPGAYWARVFARNPSGQSAPTDDVMFTVDAPPPPDPPQHPAITVAGDFVTLTWDAPASELPIAEYIVAVRDASQQADLIVFSVGTLQTAAGMVDPGSYAVRVYARSAAGQSQPSIERTFSVEPPVPPDPPTGLAATVGAHSTVTLNWTAPSSGEAPTGYVIQVGSDNGLVDLAAFDFASPQTIATFENVPSGTYYVRVLSRGPGGVSAPTTPDIVITVP